MPEPRTRLPQGTPRALIDFVRCRSNEVNIDAGDLDWLPKPQGPMIPANVTPGVTFKPGSEPGTIDISVGFGMISLTITASVENGKLEVDPPPFPGLEGQINDWVDGLNADLEANGMQFEGVSIRDGKLHLTKQAIPVPVTESVAATTTPMVAVTTPAVSPPTVLGPGAPPKTRAFHDKWVKAGVGAGALALGAAAFFLFVDGDDTTVAAPTPAVQQAEAAGNTPPPGDSEVETPPGSSGNVADSAGDTSDEIEPETVEPETVEPEPDPFGALLDGLDEFGEEQGFVGIPVFIQPDRAGDYNYCGASQATGADITGLLAYQDGDMVTLAARMAQSPLTSADQFSYAVSFQVSFASGDYRNFLWQTHAGERTIGEQMPDGTMNPGSGVEATINETGVVFAFASDPSDPVAFGMAQGFSLAQDGDAIGCDLAYGAVSPSLPPPGDRLGDCSADETTLCLNGDRFQVNVSWSDSSGSGEGVGTTVDSDSGFFYFFDDTNVDLLVRLVNGCDFDSNYWVFAAGLTDVEYNLTVTDTETGDSQAYENPLGELAQPIQDTTAFATCP